MLPLHFENLGGLPGYLPAKLDGHRLSAVPLLIDGHELVSGTAVTLRIFPRVSEQIEKL